MSEDPKEPNETELATETLAFRPARVTGFVLRDERSGEEFPVTSDAPSRLLAGSSPACVIRLEGRAVSRRHAAFDVQAHGLRVIDLDSTNGTWLNNSRVADAFATVGDRLRLGDVVLRVMTMPVAVVAAPPLRSAFGEFLGASAAIQRLYPLMERLAAADVPVLLEGETGTGKEIVAEALHTQGSRRDGPYVVFDCTATPPSLMESELFGFERGAFTGAQASHPGLVELAEGGTLLIDEIGDLDPSLQPKLLRMLDRGEVRRLGGRTSKKTNVRFIAATRRNLDAEVTAGRFRDDVFHRIVVGRLELPPLRARTGDVALLATHFARKLAAGPLPEKLLAAWESHSWPGNVRELRAAVARYVSLGDDQLSAKRKSDAGSTDSSDVIERVLAMKLPLHSARREVLAEFERRYVDGILALTEGNVSRAAELAGIARRNFQVLKAKVKVEDVE